MGKFNRPLTTWDILLLTTCDWDFPWCFGWKAAIPSSLLWVVGLRCEGRAARVFLKGLAMLKKEADDCVEAEPLALAFSDCVRAENRPSFLKKAGSCQSCERQLCNGLKGRVGTVSEGEGNRDGQLTKRQFSSIVVRGLKLRYGCLLKGFTVKFHARAYVWCMEVTKNCWEGKKRRKADRDGPFPVWQKICD